MEESDMLDIVKNLSTKLPKFKDGRINYSKSTIAPVVNSFVKYKDKILILRRGEKVAAYKGMWNGISGYIDEIKTIEEKALEEIWEETKIPKSIISNIKIGKPFKLKDAKIKKTWILCPVLVELTKLPKIKLDSENVEYKWIYANQIKDFKTVPGLENELAAVLC